MVEFGIKHRARQEWFAGVGGISVEIHAGVELCDRLLGLWDGGELRELAEAETLHRCMFGSLGASIGGVGGGPRILNPRIDTVVGVGGIYRTYVWSV